MNLESGRACLPTCLWLSVPKLVVCYIYLLIWQKGQGFLPSFQWLQPAGENKNDTLLRVQQVNVSINHYIEDKLSLKMKEKKYIYNIRLCYICAMTCKKRILSSTHYTSPGNSGNALDTYYRKFIRLKTFSK